MSRKKKKPKVARALVPENVTCPYCQQPAKQVDGTIVYPHRPDLADKQFYRCEPCGAYVGCHPGTLKPLGRLANIHLRRLKMSAHAAFDPLWKRNNKRHSAYAWLARELAIDPSFVHIGMMDEDCCVRTIEICKLAHATPNFDFSMELT